MPGRVEAPEDVRPDLIGIRLANGLRHLIERPLKRLGPCAALLIRHVSPWPVTGSMTGVSAVEAVGMFRTLPVG